MTIFNAIILILFPIVTAFVCWAIWNEGKLISFEQGIKKAIKRRLSRCR